MRSGSWERLKEWIGSFKKDHAGEKIRLGFGGWLCHIARAIGVAIFVVSCGAVLLPFVIGAGWIETLFVMATGLMIARQFLFFHHLYFEVEAFIIYVWDRMFRSRTWTFYWDQDPKNPKAKKHAA